ncbi:hypothetical protein FSARC_5753 [Fusarium sarcochroum]|uniref:Protein kinase domain-containing protein n=1 Tax=Fusarium sarcochroum TaxID=1208366 RepID=A0A8H4XA44_9HYPO|nr:hypothetical protein FSARC_5753 [Fusarium sarcochroum]
MISPTLDTDPKVIFSLVPMNPGAFEVVNNPLNNHLFKREDGRNEINVFFDPTTSAGLFPSVMGRTGHIIVDRIGISKFHCSFSIHMETGEILLVDHSPSHTLEFYGNNVRQFVVDGLHAPAVVIDAKVNRQFGFGGTGASWFKWKIKWYKEPPIDVEAWARGSGNHRFGQDCTVRDFPPTQRLEHCALENRFLHREKLVDKTLTKVQKAVDAYSGQYVAIKTVTLPHDLRRFRMLEEACDYTDLVHPHIIEFLQVEISQTHFNLVMDLQDGNIEELGLEDQEFAHAEHLFSPTDNVARPLLHQMLSALDYLASKDIIHRDVKPQNILYRRVNGSMHYRLADFGVATSDPEDQYGVGSTRFKAPEVLFRRSKRTHTTKIDVWSLWATLIWVFDLYKPPQIGKFRDILIQDDGREEKIVNEVQKLAKYHGPAFVTMARLIPKQRASAAELLDSMFGGVGRITGNTRRGA